MKIRTIWYALPLFIAMYIGHVAYGVTGPTLELTQKPHEISGIDKDSDVAFAALLTLSDQVIIDASVGGKQIHAEIDYKNKTLRIRSLSKANGASVRLSDKDIIAFQKLRVSLVPSVNTRNRHGDALTSFVNLMATAPAVAIDINTSGPAFTPICGKIGGPGIATYTTGLFRQIIHNDNVTVGPVCYIPPALGRCGAAAGPDPNIGLVQRYTQQCLNHDQCCVATMKSPPVCGIDCFGEFIAAANGFFFAPDCGTTAGTWIDNFERTWFLTGGDSSGQATAFSGTVDARGFGCGIWNVAGRRIGTNITFRATNPSVPSDLCAKFTDFTGAYSDCNVANGSWTNSALLNGSWSWTRTNTVDTQTVSVRGNTFGPAWYRGPAAGASHARAP